MTIEHTSTAWTLISSAAVQLYISTKHDAKKEIDLITEWVAEY